MEKINLIPNSCFLGKAPLTPCNKSQAHKIISNRLFKPRSDCAEITLSIPIDWEAKDKNSDRNWRMQLQGWAMFFPVMGFFDTHDNKDEIIHYFIDVMVDWHKNYGYDHDDIVTKRIPESYAWYDMSVGFRALVLAYFRNRIKYYELVISEESQLLLNGLIEKHINHLSYEKVFSLNNHGIFQIQGLMALIHSEGKEKYYAQFEYCLNKMEQLIRSQYDCKGVHLEHSPYYHFYALTAFERILMSDWYRDRPIIKEIVQKSQSVKKWIVDPLACPACVGDSILKEQKINFSDEVFKEELEIKTSNGILSNFIDSGYQIYRSDWKTATELATYVFIMGMYHTKTHKHRDCLSFEWFDAGRKIICDSGKYGHVRDKFRNYFLSSRAHNSLEIENFDILQKDPYGSCLKDAQEKNGVIYVSGQLDYSDVFHKRELRISSGKWLIVIDEFKYSKARKTTQWFHLAKDFTLLSANNNRVALVGENRELIIRCMNKEFSCSFYHGDEDVMQGFISEKDFHYEANLAIGFLSKTQEGRVVTILALSEEDETNAMEYLSSENEKILAEPEVTNQEVDLLPTNLLGNLPHINRTHHLRYDLIEGKRTYQFCVDGINLIFFADIKMNSKKLTILLPGAIDRSKTLQNFQRYSWSDDIDGSVISILDPTVTCENDISIGWFQGNKDHYAMPIFVSFVKMLLQNNGIDEKDLTLFGSSAGGFVCLKIANEFLDSRVIVINPQTYIYNYSLKEYRKLVQWIFPELTPQKAREVYGDRLKISLDFIHRTQPILYYQNEYDFHHVEKHLNVFLKTAGENNYNIYYKLNKMPDFNAQKLNIIYYSDIKSAHSPLGKEETLKILNIAT